MTVDELIDKCHELQIDVQPEYSSASNKKYSTATFALFYNNRNKFGEIIYKNKNHYIHSHYWKKQDENILDVPVEKFGEKLVLFIKTIKYLKIKSRMKNLEKDFE